MPATIVIKELEDFDDEKRISNIVTVIQMKSEFENIEIQFFLETIITDWDTSKLETNYYVQTIKKWKKTANNNAFNFNNEMEKS